MTVRRYLRNDFDIIPHSNPLVNTFFKSFFTFFDIFLRLLDVIPPEWATCAIIPRYFALVKYNFCVFYPFYTFLAFCPKYIRQNGRLFCRKSKKTSATVIKARKRAGFLPYYIYACAGGKSKKTDASQNNASVFLFLISLGTQCTSLLPSRAR